MSDVMELIGLIKDLAQEVDFDEEGGAVSTYFLGRYLWAPLPTEVNDIIFRLLVLVEKLEDIELEKK